MLGSQFGRCTLGPFSGIQGLWLPARGFPSFEYSPRGARGRSHCRVQYWCYPTAASAGNHRVSRTFVVWYLYKQIRDKDRERKRTAVKDSKGSRWKVILSTAVIVGGLLFAWQKLLPGVFPSVRDPFIWAIPVLFGALGSSWLFGDDLYMWQAFGRTRRSWRRHNLGTGLLGLVCVLALSGLLAPADLFVNVGFYVLFFVLCNASLWLGLVGVIGGMSLLGFIRGVEMSQPTGAIVCVVCIVLVLPVHYFYPLYANTQRIPEWSK